MGRNMTGAKLMAYIAFNPFPAVIIGAGNMLFSNKFELLMFQRTLFKKKYLKISIREACRGWWIYYPLAGSGSMMSQCDILINWNINQGLFQ